MRSLKTIILIALLFLSNSVAGATVTADLDIPLPVLIGTSPINIELDFGVPGDQLSNVSVDMFFADNLWDIHETVQFTIPVLSEFYVTNSLLKSTGPGVDELHNSSLFTNIFIDESGLADIFINISTVSGDGLFVTDIIFNADYTPVPLPSAAWLFVSGLLALTASRKFELMARR